MKLAVELIAIMFAAIIAFGAAATVLTEVISRLLFH
jgi:hypothetical protein